MVLGKEPGPLHVGKFVPYREKSCRLGGRHHLPTVVGASVRRELAPEKGPLAVGLGGAEGPVGLRKGPQGLLPHPGEPSLVGMPVAQGQIEKERGALLFGAFVKGFETVLLLGDHRFEAVGFSGKEKRQEAIEGGVRLNGPARQGAVGLEEVQGQIAVEVGPLQDGGQGLPVEGGRKLPQGMESSPEDLAIRAVGLELSRKLLEGRLKEGGKRTPGILPEAVEREEAGIGPTGQMGQKLLLSRGAPLHSCPRKKRQNRFLDLPYLPEALISSLGGLLPPLGDRRGSSPGKMGEPEPVPLVVGIADDGQGEMALSGRSTPEILILVFGQKDLSCALFVPDEGRRPGRKKKGALRGSPMAKLHPKLKAIPDGKVADEGRNPPVELESFVGVQREDVGARKKKEAGEAAAVAHEGLSGEAGEIEEAVNGIAGESLPTPHDEPFPGGRKRSTRVSSPPPTSEPRREPSWREEAERGEREDWRRKEIPPGERRGAVRGPRGPRTDPEGAS